MCSLYLCLGEATTDKWSYRENFREGSEPIWHFSGPPVSQGVVLSSKEVTVRGGWYFPLFSFFSATSIAPIAYCGPYFKAGTRVLVSSPGMDVWCSKYFLGQVMCLAFYLHHFMYSSGHLWEVSAVIFDLLLGKQRLNWDVDSGISDSTRHWCLMVRFSLSLTPSLHCCYLRPAPWVDGAPTLHPCWFLKYVHSPKYWNLSSLRTGTSSLIATVYPHCPTACLTYAMHVRIPGMING